MLKLVHSGTIRHLELVFRVPEELFGPPDGVVARSLEDRVHADLRSDAAMAGCVREGKIAVRWIANLG